MKKYETSIDVIQLAKSKIYEIMVFKFNMQKNAIKVLVVIYVIESLNIVYIYNYLCKFVFKNYRISGDFAN